MNISDLKFILGRCGRDYYSILQYPIWINKARPAPDNHIYKKRRIKLLARKHGCKTFIETGTFYGQMVKYAISFFDVVISVEIFPPFQKSNESIFRGNSKVHILLGDSSKCIPSAISLAQGPVLFWLDGHYSGFGTGIGDKVSPIIEELQLIALTGQANHCIVIDDRRLFTGKDGYPTIAETEAELKKINPLYRITKDLDSIIAEPN